MKGQHNRPPWSTSSLCLLAIHLITINERIPCHLLNFLIKSRDITGKIVSVHWRQMIQDLPLQRRSHILENLMGSLQSLTSKRYCNMKKERVGPWVGLRKKLSHETWGHNITHVEHMETQSIGAPPTQLWPSHNEDTPEQFPEKFARALHHHHLVANQPKIRQSYGRWGRIFYHIVPKKMFKNLKS